MNLFVELCKDYMRYETLAIKRMNQIINASHQNKDFEFDSDEIEILCSKDVLFSAFSIFLDLIPSLGERLALDLSLDYSMKKYCRDYQTYCRIRRYCSRKSIREALPGRFHDPER